MSIFKTGRETTLRAETSFSLGYNFERSFANTDQRNDLAIPSLLVFAFMNNQVQVLFDVSYLKIPLPTSLSVKLTAQTVDDYNETAWTHVASANSAHPRAIGTLTGTASIHIDVEEMCDVSLPPSGYIEIDGSNFPSYGGSAYPDDLEAAKATLFQQMKVGGNIVCTITIGTLSLTVTTPITLSNQALIDDFLVYHRLTGFSHASDGSGVPGPTITCSMLSKYNDVPLSVSYSRTWSSAEGAVTANANTCGFTVSSNPADPGYTATADVRVGVSVPILYNLDGRIRSCDHDNTDALQMVVQDKAALSGESWVPRTITVPIAGSASQTITQEHYYAFSILNGDQDAYQEKHEHAPVYAYLQNAALGAAGEDPRDWVLTFHGKPYPSATISHAADTILDGCSSLAGWSAGANTTLSVVGGALRMVVGAGGGGGATRAFSHARSEYRYLQARIRSVGSANKSFSYVLSNGTIIKTYDGSTGADGAYKLDTLDMCAPIDIESGEDVDATDSRWPLDAAGGKPDPALHGKMWGYDYIDSFQVTGLPPGTYELDLVQFHRDTFAQLTVQPAFLSMATAWTTLTTTVQQNPFAILNIDGKLVDFPAVMHTTPTTGDPNYTFRAISDVLGDIDAVPGWTVTENPTPDPDGFHTNSRQGLYLFGGGAVALWSSSTSRSWVDAWDVDARSELAVYSQPRYHIVQSYPMCGNPWGSFPFENVPTPLAFTKVLRGEAWGITYLANALPAHGAQVVAYEPGAPGTLIGNVLSDLQGCYTTHAPCGKGNHSVKTEYRKLPLAYLSHSDTWANRKRRRVAFAHGTAPATKALSYDVGRSSRHLRAVQKDGNLAIGGAHNVAPLPFADTDSGLPIDYAAVQVYRNSPGHELHILTSESGAVKLRTTIDEGRALSAPATIGSGTHVALEIAEHSNRYLYWNDGGVLKGKVLDRQSNVLSPTFTARASVDDAGHAVCEYIDGQGVWRLALLCSEGGTLKLFSSVDAQSFALASTIGTGTRCTITRGGHLIYLYWIDSDGSGGYLVRGQIRNRQLGLVKSTFIAKTGVDADGVAAAESCGDSGAFRIGLLVSIAGAPVHLFATDGQNFA